MRWKCILRLSILLSLANWVSPERILVSPHITDWGSWGLWEYCPSDSFVTGVQLYTHSPQGILRDDKSLTGIRLFCNSYGRALTNKGIQSSIDNEGTWGKKFFCPGVMTGFQMRNEQYRSVFVDDTAANNLRMFCDGNLTSYKEGDGNSFGKWSGRKSCEQNEVICGISTQIDKKASWDQTGLNNVMMKCCDIPNPLEKCVPKTTWQLIATCNNTSGDTKACKYNRKVGVSYADEKSKIISLYNRAGYELKKLATQLRSKMLNKSAIASAMKNAALQEDSKEEYWSFSPTYVWEPRVIIGEVLMTKKGHHRELYQLHASCGILEVWGIQLKKVDHTKLNDHESKSTSFVNLNDNFIEADY